MTGRLLLVLALATGCASVPLLQADLVQAANLVARARASEGVACAPRPLANAEASLAIAEARMLVGDGLGAAKAAADARIAGEEALRLAEPCGQADRDADGVVDAVDRCPDEPEDRDGDRDEDGCPDIDPAGDLDRDGVPNIDDLCPREPEDFDGHADEDGCPETSEDADGDTIPDALDACVHDAEDMDGFKDADGCPDPDNDLDGLVDVRDGCPDAAEDQDGWDDFDGCPDDDNDADGVDDLTDACPDHPGTIDNRGCPAVDRDGDGVGDAQDQCPDAAEVHNGYLDQDGCPDEAAAGVQIQRDRIGLARELAFVGETATLAVDAIAVIDELARVLRDLPGRRLRIEGHLDGSMEPGEASRLSLARAAAVRDALVRAGIDDSRLEVDGLGNTRPIDTNRTSAGRAANRRIELLLVD
ncbi:MAG: OmpA family protein [Alphaproteobacteria bacterium]|nr:OmpA family protein [Alphaproteobacteria bacterium]